MPSTRYALPRRPLLWKPASGPGGLAVDWSHPSAQALNSFFLFTEGGGKQVWDLASPSRRGTMSAASTWGFDRWGPYAKGSNTSTQFNTFSSNIVTVGASWSVELMIRSTATQQGGACVLSNGSNYGVTFDSTGTKISVDGTGQTAETTAFTVGVWYHEIVCWDGTNSTFYRNGLANGSGTGAGSTAPATFDSWEGATTALLQFNGDLAWFRVYSRIIPAIEALTLFADPFGMVRVLSEESRVFSIPPPAGLTTTAILERVSSPPKAPPFPWESLFSPPAGGTTPIVAQAGVGIGVNAPVVTLQTAQAISAQAGLGIGVNAASVVIQTAQAISASAGLGIGVNAASVVIQTAQAISATAGLGIGVLAPTVTIQTAQAISAQSGLGIGVLAPVVTLQTAQAISAQAGVGIGILTNLVLQTGGGAITAQAGVGIGVGGNVSLLSAQQIAAQAGVGVGVNASVLTLRVAALLALASGLGIGIAPNLILTAGGQIVAGDVFLLDTAFHTATLADTALHTVALADVALAGDVVSDVTLGTVTITDSAVATVTLADSAP